MMQKIVERIIKNEAEPISAKELSVVFGVNDSVVRTVINQLRSEGCPICSCRKGYYYSEDSEDIKRTVNSLKHRISSIQTAINGLSDLLEVGH